MKKFKEFIISESYNPSYEEVMIGIFNKALRDELEASINYKIMAEQIVGPGINAIKQELLDHSKEEFEHFNQFVSYASDHDFLERVEFSIRTEMVNPKDLPTNVDGIVEFTQNLEMDAYNDYKNAAVIAEEEGDMETRMFFEELMKDEMGHYDDVSNLSPNSKPRKLNEEKE